MDRLAEHEAFLRAIFDAPDDDTPRLVYADFLEENGEPERAEFIRVQCELARSVGTSNPDRRELLRSRERELATALTPADTDPAAMHYSRGFAQCLGALVRPEDLDDPDTLRRSVVAAFPEWFGATKLAVLPGHMLREHHIEPLFALPALARVTEWDLGGHVEEVAVGPQTTEAGTFALIDMHEEPVITVEGVMALARNRGARRIETLILSHNNLDNTAARAIVQSPHLIRLRRLEILRGNQFLGRTWRQLLERYGENVVG